MAISKSRHDAFLVCRDWTWTVIYFTHNWRVDPGIRPRGSSGSDDRDERPAAAVSYDSKCWCAFAGDREYHVRDCVRADPPDIGPGQTAGGCRRGVGQGS